MNRWHCVGCRLKSSKFGLVLNHVRTIKHREECTILNYRLLLLLSSFGIEVRPKCPMKSPSSCSLTSHCGSEDIEVDEYSEHHTVALEVHFPLCGWWGRRAAVSSL